MSFNTRPALNATLLALAAEGVVAIGIIIALLALVLGIWP